MTRLVFPVAVLMGAGASWAQGQIPPGYEVVKITDDPEDDRYPRMNNCGEVVFHKALPGDLLGVFLYDNGKTTQVSVDGDFNTFPDINDNGVIVWSRWEDETPKHILIYEDGLITQLTDDPLEDYTPRVNNLGHVVWFRSLGGGCGGGADAEIMFYDGTTIEQLTDNGYSNQLGSINDHDEVAWTQYDFCVTPWRSQIMLWVDGVTTQLTTGQLEPQSPTINNRGQVAWGSGVEGIDLWEDGVTTHLTDWGRGPSINDQGQLIFHRWHDDEEIGHVWWYGDGVFYQITNDGLSSDPGPINDAGEAVWRILDPDHRDIGMLRRVRDGDVNLDFDVDAEDLASFPECMTGPAETDHLCECRFFDVDRDRDVDMEDYVIFQTAFTGEGS